MDVAVVSKVRLYRESVTQLLGAASQIRIVGVCSDDEAELRESAAEVALVCGELRRAAHLAALAPNVKVVALLDGEHVDELVGGVEAGIAGFAPAESSLDDLVETLERASLGELPCPPELAGALARRLARPADRADRQRPKLTPRELEVLNLMATGLANKEIAQRLGRRLPTVKNHVRSILSKFEAHSRTEAVARANGDRRLF